MKVETARISATEIQLVISGLGGYEEPYGESVAGACDGGEDCECANPAGGELKIKLARYAAE